MNSRERLLLVFFVVLGLGVATWLGWEQLAGWEARLARQEHAVRLKETEARLLLADKGRWEQRRQWLAEKQPVRTTQGTDDAAFLQAIQETARQHRLSFSSPQLLNPEFKPGMVSSSVTIRLKSTPADLQRWLYAFQQPEAFVEAPSLRMQPDTESPALMIVDLTLRKWFRTP